MVVWWRRGLCHHRAVPTSTSARDARGPRPNVQTRVYQAGEFGHGQLLGVIAGVREQILARQLLDEKELTALIEAVQGYL
jgi:hypothetical protein